MNDHKHLTASDWDRLIRFWLDTENSEFWADKPFYDKFKNGSLYRTAQANRKFAAQMYRRLTLGYAK